MRGFQSGYKSEDILSIPNLHLKTTYVLAPATTEQVLTFIKKKLIKFSVGTKHSI